VCKGKAKTSSLRGDALGGAVTRSRIATRRYTTKPSSFVQFVKAALAASTHGRTRQCMNEHVRLQAGSERKHGLQEVEGITALCPCTYEKQWPPYSQSWHTRPCSPISLFLDSERACTKNGSCMPACHSCNSTTSLHAAITYVKGCYQILLYRRIHRAHHRLLCKATQVKAPHVAGLHRPGNLCHTRVHAASGESRTVRLTCRLAVASLRLRRSAS
jgi:hypothetical protein